ncbi:hypothetical protein [Granulicella sp. dw_53]|uniref:DUF6950 family protein n=1 Tax=Granulicella sp. dw_53 TaxID=2719792 RepID=UPI001BD3FB2A|nr:hypothetical protein [Granulicella sp. dw_53]
MSLAKHPHWREKHFHAFLLERSDIPFAWGTNDCALFAADAIQACTGIDIAADFRGKYTTQLGALRTISKLTGGSSIVDAATYCAEKHNLTEHTHPLMAKRGDLVVIDNAGTLIAGVVHLNGREVISVSENGLVRLPIADLNGQPNVVRAWSI